MSDKKPGPDYRELAQDEVRVQSNKPRILFKCMGCGVAIKRRDSKCIRCREPSLAQETHLRVHNARQRRFSDDELLAAIRARVDSDGAPPTAGDFGSNPSARAISRRFGSWNQAIELAGLAPRASGEQRGPLKPGRKRLTDRVQMRVRQMVTGGKEPLTPPPGLPIEP